MTTNQNLEIQPIWTVAANIVHERPYGPGGQETRIGTKHFRPRTKIYIIDWYPGTCQQIIVVGLGRKPRRFIKVVIRADLVENLRVTLCHNPNALKKIYQHFDTEFNNIDRLTKEFAETMQKTIPNWQKELKKNKNHNISTKAINRDLEGSKGNVNAIYNFLSWLRGRST